MAKRILLAGVLGGLALFFWGFLSHTVIGLGNVGITNLPAPAYDGLKASVTSPGFYRYPQEDSSGKIATDNIGGPHGIVIFQPSGASMMMTGQLINEVILNVIQALLAAFLLSLATGLARYPQRVGFVFGLGILSAIASNVEYWIWDAFPSNYSIASVVDKLVAFLIVGLVVAAIVKPAAKMMQVMSAKAA